MGVYSSTQVYPPEYDEVNTTECDYCTFECDIYQYCIKEVARN